MERTGPSVGYRLMVVPSALLSGWRAVRGRCSLPQDLNKAGGGGRRGCGRAHGGIVLRARGGVQVDRDSAGHDHGRVIAEIEIARDAIDHRDGSEKNERTAASCRRARTLRP